MASNLASYEQIYDLACSIYRQHNDLTPKYNRNQHMEILYNLIYNMKKSTNVNIHAINSVLQEPITSIGDGVMEKIIISIPCVATCINQPIHDNDSLLYAATENETDILTILNKSLQQDSTRLCEKAEFNTFNPDNTWNQKFNLNNNIKLQIQHNQNKKIIISHIVRLILMVKHWFEHTDEKFDGTMPVSKLSHYNVPNQSAKSIYY